MYDDAGNRTEENQDGQTTTYTYTDDDQIDQITLPDLSVLDYDYDDRGNLSQITAGTDITSFSFDAQDRLTQITKPDTSSVVYTYDYDGRRISETIGTDELHHLWDEQSTYGDIVLEYDENDVVVATYTLAEDRIISQTRGANTHYYLTDGQRNVRALSNSSATTTDTYRYDAYGELKDPTGTTENPYLYTGQRFDSFSDLYNLRARSYDPNVGRFLSRDTYPIDFNNPIELNRYGYTANNPINGYDPTGYSDTLLEYAKVTIKVGVGALATASVHSNEDVLEAIEHVLEEVQEAAETTKDQAKKTFGDAQKNFAENGVQKFCETTKVCPKLGGYGSPLGFWGKVAFGAIVATIILAQTLHMTQPHPEPQHQGEQQGEQQNEEEDECKKYPFAFGCNEDDFDLAFGISPYIYQFAGSFPRPTKPFREWPDWMTTDADGNPLRYLNRIVYISNFHYMMDLYFTKIPHGRMKFNLEGMDDSEPDSITNWELNEIFYSPFYNTRTDYYDMINGVRVQLTGSDLVTKVNSILN